MQKGRENPKETFYNHLNNMTIASLLEKIKKEIESSESIEDLESLNDELSEIQDLIQEKIEEINEENEDTETAYAQSRFGKDSSDIYVLLNQFSFGCEGTVMLVTPSPEIQELFGMEEAKFCNVFQRWEYTYSGEKNHKELFQKIKTILQF